MSGRRPGKGEEGTDSRGGTARDFAAESTGGENEPPLPESATLESRLDRARFLKDRGRRGEALAEYRAAVAMDPTSVRARNNLGVFFDETGSHAMALEHFRAARDLDPENVEVLSNLGAALGALGRFDEAEQALRRALRLDPERVDVRANLGILAFRRGLYQEAETELRWVCRQEGDHPAAHFYRGEALNRLGRVDEALEMLERASHLQPRSARTFYLMGILYDKKHLPEQARAMYRKARELTGS